MKNNIFSEQFRKNFYSVNFGKKYLYQNKIIENTTNAMSLDILNEMLSIRSHWNNKNFIMMLDKQNVKYTDYSSLFLETSGQNLRPDVDKVQNWISKGASIVLNEIDNLNASLINIANELQNMTNGRCQGNLYFSMQSRQAFGPHCDPHDVFAIHFEGEKVWNIYENIEINPINHPMFKPSAEERIKRAGKIIDQITLKPGDLLYLPRGQYHDALASKSGAIHIAFGLTYVKPIDLLPLFYEKSIPNDFMRKDLKINATKDDLKNDLKKLSIELQKIINSDETLDLVTENIKSWPYKFKNYSLSNIVAGEKSYKVSKSIRIEKKGKEAFLTNGKQKVNIPHNYLDITAYILKQEFITFKSISLKFNNTPEKIIKECIEKMSDMEVLS